MKPVRRLSSLSQRSVEQMIYDHKTLTQFIKERDVPRWYRGLSNTQNQAGRDLLNALRDDAEQSTTHRVRHCLELIGLVPLPSDNDIIMLMLFSRGNDLAFLWFLMDYMYRSKSKKYSLNEQIIMNVIAMLDMVMTMRGLDQVLPPPQPPKTLIERMRRKKPMKRPSPTVSVIDLMASRHKPKFKLPYFEKLPHLVPYGKPLTSTPPNHQVKFDFYENYANPNYMVPNEYNRWFTCPLNVTKRMVNHIITDDLLASQTGVVWTKHDNTCAMCAHHRIIDELEKSLKHELEVIARNRCLGNREMAQKAERVRVREEIEKRAEFHMRNFKRLANSTRKSMSHLCLLNADATLDLEPKPQPPTPPPKQEKDKDKRLKRKTSKRRITKRLKGGAEIGADIPPEGTCMCTMDDITPACPKPNPYPTPCTQEVNDDCLLYSPSEQALGWRRIFSKQSDCAKNDSKTNGSLFKQCCYRAYDPLPGYDYAHKENMSSPSPSQTYFRAPSPTRPYKIDYDRIFYFKNVYGTDMSRDLREASLRAIDSKSVMDPLHNFHESKMDATVHECSKRIFQKRFEKYMTARELRLKNAQLRASEPDFVYYDPDNKDVMHRLLREGLDRLAKDTQYVLPSMPDAHKHPTLRYWIYRRYGKVFSHKELDREWRKSARVLRILLDSDENQVKLRRPKNLAIGIETTYACRDHIIATNKYLRDDFYRQIDRSVMEKTRTLFLAMNPYLTSKGPPWRPFFAYLPARRLDINHVAICSVEKRQRSRTSYSFHQRSQSKGQKGLDKF